MPPTKHKQKHPKRYVELPRKRKRSPEPSQCDTCDAATYTPCEVDTLGRRSHGIAIVCGSCFECDSCGSSANPPRFILDSEDIVCRACGVAEVSPCSYCGHTGIANDPTSICTGPDCKEVICAECEISVALADRICACEKV